MAKGLADLIGRVKRDPSNKVLVHRLLVLLAEMPDTAEKLHLTMDLAKAMFKTMPFDSLRLAHVVFGKASTNQEFAQQGFDVGSMKLMVESLKELGRFAKATILEVELDKLIEIKKNRGKEQRQFKGNDVNKLMRQFSDEISHVAGQREDSLGNILTQLAKGQKKSDQKFKLPDLDLFGKDEAPIRGPREISHSLESVVVAEESDDVLPGFRVSELMEHENQLQMPGRKHQASVNGEQMRFPERKQDQRSSQFSLTDFSKNNTVSMLTDHDIDTIGVALELMQEANAELEPEDAAPLALSPAANSTPAAEAESPDYGQAQGYHNGPAGQSDYFSLHLDQQESPVLIKRTPVFREDADSHTQMSPMPQYEQPDPVASESSDSWQSVSRQEAMQVDDPVMELTEMNPQEEVRHHPEMSVYHQPEESSVAMASSPEPSYAEPAGAQKKQRKAKLKTQRGAAASHDQLELLQRLQDLVHENRRAAHSVRQVDVPQKLLRQEKYLQQELELARFFFAWLKRLAPTVEQSLAHSQDIAPEVLQSWERLWTQASGSVVRERHVRWLRMWQQCLLQREQDNLFRSSLSVMIGMILNYGVRSWWLFAQKTMGPRQAADLAKAMLACLKHTNQWRRLLFLAQELLLLVEDLPTAKRWYQVYVLACRELQRTPLRWQQEQGLADLRVMMLQRPRPRIALMSCAG